MIDESTYKATDANEHWENIKLDRTTTEGVYMVTFSNPNRTVTYKVRPVLAEADYDAALKTFIEKSKLYEQASKIRINKDKAIEDSSKLSNKQIEEEWNAENERINKLNKMIIARNKELKEQQQKLIEEINKQARINEELFKEQQLLWQKNQEKYRKDLTLSNEVIRTFTINNFGVWNCDHPQFPDKEILIRSEYTNLDNSYLNLNTVSVVYKGFNGITQFPTPSQIRIIPGTENMLLSIKDEYLYYFSYKDFMNAHITAKPQNFLFLMRKHPQPISSYLDIKEIIDKL